MRKDERLKTIYETIAPYIMRTEGNWRDYLAFAAVLTMRCWCMRRTRM